MMEHKWQMYIRYGVIHSEKEMRELWQLTCEVAKALWKEEFTLQDQCISRDEKERAQVNLLYKFNVGFCEGIVFQNVLICMKLLEMGIDKESIVRILGIEESIVDEIELEQAI